MKIKVIEIIVLVILAIIIARNIGIHSSNQIASQIINESAQEYLIDIEKRGSKTVVLVLSGTAFIEKKATTFVEEHTINTLKGGLTKSGFTVITLATPCTIRCLDEYTQLGLIIANLKPAAVVYKGIHSDFGTDSFNNILKKASIPIYTFGTEPKIDYKLYTGPDNEGLGFNMANYLKGKGIKDKKVVYIRTIDVLNNNVLDNGYQRMNAIEKYLKEIGAIDAGSVYTLWNRGRTYDEIYRLLFNDESVEYIVAPSVETAEGAIEAIEDLKKKYSTKEYKTKVVVLDFTPRSVELLLEGRLEAAISQEITQQALKIADVISSNKNIKSASKELFSTKVVTVDNLKDFELSPGNYLW